MPHPCLICARRSSKLDAPSLRAPSHSPFCRSCSSSARSARPSSCGLYVCAPPNQATPQPNTNTPHTLSFLFTLSAALPFHVTALCDLSAPTTQPTALEAPHNPSQPHHTPCFILRRPMLPTTPCNLILPIRPVFTLHAPLNFRQPHCTPCSSLQRPMPLLNPIHTHVRTTFDPCGTLLASRSPAHAAAPCAPYDTCDRDRSASEPDPTLASPLRGEKCRACELKPPKLNRHCQSSPPASSMRQTARTLFFPLERGTHSRPGAMAGSEKRSRR